MISFYIEASPMRFEPLYSNDYSLRIDNFPCYRGEFLVHLTQGDQTFTKRFFVTYCEEISKLERRKNYLYHGYFAIFLPRLRFPDLSKQEQQKLKKRIRSELLKRLDVLEKEIQQDIVKHTTNVSKVAIYEREYGDYYFKVYIKGYKHMLSINVGVSNGNFYMHQFNEMISKYKTRWYRGESYYYHEEILQQLVEILKSHPRFRIRLINAREKDYLLPSYKEKTFNVSKIKVVSLT